MNRSRILFGVVALYTVCVYGPMAAMSIGAAVTFASWLVLRWGNLRKDLGLFRRSAMFWPTVVFLVAMVWSLVWASIAGISFYGASPQVDWIGDTKKLWHLAFPFILAAVLTQLSDRDLKRLGWLWFGLGLASAILGIAQHYVPLLKPQAIPEIPGRYHAAGFAGFHLSYAAIMGFPTGVSFAALVLLLKKEGFSRNSAIALGCALVFTLANFFTLSKIVWGIIPIVAIVVALIAFRGWPRIAFAAAVVAITVAFSLSSEVRARFPAWKILTIEQRMSIWSANFEIFKQNPVFGVGWQQNGRLAKAYYEAHPGSVGFESHAHSNMLEQATNTGLFGLGAYLWWSVAVFLVTFALYRQTTLALFWRTAGLGVCAGWLALFLSGLTQANFWDAKVMHQLAWVTAMAMEAYRRYAKEKT